jgi:hypothetical protein
MSFIRVNGHPSTRLGFSLYTTRNPGWIVKDVDLFTTTVIYGNTNEIATLSNGSLASWRVINMRCSKDAVLCIYNKFSTEVEYEKVQIFEEATRKFVKAQPREWASFDLFCAAKVVADLRYIGKLSCFRVRILLSLLKLTFSFVLLFATRIRDDVAACK